MRLFLLTTEHWDYDCNEGFLIRAKDEKSARQMAQERIADEELTHPELWLLPEYSTCECLLAAGEPGILLKSFHAG
jgi:hypothetical protein